MSTDIGIFSRHMTCPASPSSPRLVSLLAFAPQQDSAARLFSDPICSTDDICWLTQANLQALETALSQDIPKCVACCCVCQCAPCSTALAVLTALQVLGLTMCMTCAGMWQPSRTPSECVSGGASVHHDVCVNCCPTLNHYGALASTLTPADPLSRQPGTCAWYYIAGLRLQQLFHGHSFPARTHFTTQLRCEC